MISKTAGPCPAVLEGETGPSQGWGFYYLSDLSQQSIDVLDLF
jgi:hypothetical protein